MKQLPLNLRITSTTPAVRFNKRDEATAAVITDISQLIFYHQRRQPDSSYLFMAIATAGVMLIAALLLNRQTETAVVLDGGEEKRGDEKDALPAEATAADKIPKWTKMPAGPGQEAARQRQVDIARAEAQKAEIDNQTTEKDQLLDPRIV